MPLPHMCNIWAHRPAQTPLDRTSKHAHIHTQFLRSTTVDSLYAHQKKMCPSSLDTQHTLVGKSQQTQQQQHTSLGRSKSCSSTQKGSKSDMCVLCDITVGKHSCHKKSVDYVIPVFKHTTSPSRLPSGMADTKQAAPSFPSRLRLFFQSMCTRWVRP